MHKSLRIWTLLSLLLPLMTWAQGLQLYGLQHVLPNSPLTSDFELVAIDPLSAQGTPLYTIPNTRGVESASSVFNPSASRYLFWGTNDNDEARFYSAATDTPLWEDTIVQEDRPLELQYDLQAERTYGLLQGENNAGLTFIEVDEATGHYTPIASLSGVLFVEMGTSTFDANHHRYFFIGIDANNYAKRLYSLDARSGQVLTASDPLSASRHIRTLHYDLNTDQLLALYAAPDPSRPQNPAGFAYYSTYLAEVDSLSGSVAVISNSALFGGYQASVILGSSDFDQLSRIVVAAVVNETGVKRLLLVQANDGSLIIDQPFPQDIYELKCDNRSYAEQAYTGSTSRAALPVVTFRSYPNPATDQVTVELPGDQAGATLRLIDGQGRLVQQRTLRPMQQTERLDLRTLPMGVYLLQVQVPGQKPTTQRLIKR